MNRSRRRGPIRSRRNDRVYRRGQQRLSLELLECRSLLAGLVFNDPDYSSIQWGLNNTGQNGGTYDVDIDAPEAWSITTGSMGTVLAQIDDGVDFSHADVYLNIWLNQGEIPAALGASLTDTDSDGRITFRDLNNSANAGSVTDLNATGYIDGGDLLLDARWANGVDDEANGKVDDLVGWDVLDSDNDPRPAPGFGHGTGMAQWMGAIPNNGIGKVGVNWSISIMPVRVRPGNETEVDFAVQAAGLDYAVANGAPISAIWGGGYTYSQVMYDAIDRARLAGGLVVVPARNESTDIDLSPRYPASFDSANLITVTSFNPNDGMDSVWNWGATSVDLAAPTAPGGGTSGGNAHVAGVAALLRTIHPDWNYVQLKDRILSTVEPSAALAGKTVTGGRLNAARALAATSISISDPTILEGASGTTQLTFQVTRFGDDTGEVVLDWSTVDGSASAGSDYTAAAGQITFSPGGTNSQSIAITIAGDTIDEGNENFYLSLTLISGTALLADSAGQGSLLSDDTPLVINDATWTEGSHAVHDRGPLVYGLPGAHFSPITFGPDGNLYTAVGTGSGYNTIRRYNGTTGDFMDTFIGGRVNGVRDILFRNGYVYVGSEYTDEVLRFDAGTGAFVDAFVTAGSGGINGPHGLTFGPDANGDSIPELYVSGRDSQNVVRYDGATGLPLGTYITSGSGGLSWPEGLTFNPSGTLAFVASTGSSRILKYNAQTGAYVGIAVSTGLSGPKDVKFGPDGRMYVTSGGNDRIVRFTEAGTYVDDYVPAGMGGLDNPSRLAFFGPDNDLFVTATGNSQVLRFGTQSEAVFTVSLASASSLTVSVDYATANITATAGEDYVSSSGTVTFQSGTTMRTIRVPLLDDTVYEGNETFAVTLSNASGAAIADSQGTSTIVDNEPPPTKFYVVNDASTNRTYEYSSTGSAVENYTLNSGNSAPRGAASTAAGNTVWVVDANRKVFVYNTAGGLLGSWTAGTMASNAQPEGITTNGTDVWIVDAKSDKVFKYAGAASKLSGSQNAASNFNLNGSNTSPTDLVTDGASIWVVNSSSTDKVFKYNVSGSLLGSWTISTSGAGSPTGITIDPSNVSDIWIVDSSADRVYQYTAAASQTSGNLSATASFALASGNSNPQGIADPPVGLSPGTSVKFDESTTGTTRAIDAAIGQLGGRTADLATEPSILTACRERQHRREAASDRVSFAGVPAQITTPAALDSVRRFATKRHVESLDELFGKWDEGEMLSE